MSFWLYMVACADGSLYTGIASDVARRVDEHNGTGTIGKRGQVRKPGKGARYTAARRPVELVYTAAFATRSLALKAEIRVKRLTRQQKQALIDGTAGSATQPPPAIAARCPSPDA